MPQKQCELCSSSSDVSIYTVSQISQGTFANEIYLCAVCREDVDSLEIKNANHWHCLHESIWSEKEVVKVLAWRILNKLRTENWAQDLLDQIYLEDDLLEWAKGDAEESSSGAGSVKTKDSNGNLLSDGDSVTLIKDLDVKGAGFTAKRGTLVKSITLTGDPVLVEGRVNGTLIVLKTCFLKKA